MSLKRRHVSFLVASLLTVCRADAQDAAFSRATLKGLPGVYVDLDALKPQVERDGLHSADLREGVEDTLRKSGIRVLTADESHRSAAAPALIIGVNAFRTASGSYVFSVNLGLYQSVRLTNPAVQTTDRNLAHTGIFTLAQTWGATRALGSISQLELAQGVRESVQESLNQFVKAWLSVNPKP